MFCLAGCGPRNYDNDNDRLRRENLDLTEQVTALKRENESLAKLAQATHPPTASADAAGVIPPRCARIQIASFSGGIDADRDQHDEAVRLYLHTLDSRDRFVQAVARLKITLAHLPPGQPALTLAVAQIDPARFDAAYRSGLTGTHYTIEVPVANVPPGVVELTCRVALTDLQTGLEHQTESLVRFNP
jgi:putative intracellular protease/amidase